MHPTTSPRTRCLLAGLYLALLAYQVVRVVQLVVARDVLTTFTFFFKLVLIFWLALGVPRLLRWARGPRAASDQPAQPVLPGATEGDAPLHPGFRDDAGPPTRW